MKPICILAVLISFSCISCKKDSTGNNNGSGGGTGGSSLSISSITPIAYCDDTITITGNGFNTDKTKDTVDFGILKSSGLYSIPDANACVVNSATATQIKVTITNSFNFGGNLIFLNPLAVARVRTTNGTVYSGNIYFKATPLFNDMEDSDNSSGPNVVRAGDSVYCTSAIGIGNYSVAEFSLSGQAFRPQIDSNTYCTFGFTLPNKLYGTPLDESIHQTKTMTLTMRDGKTIDQVIDVYTSPLMKVNAVNAAVPAFYQSTAPAGAVETITVNGLNLKSDAMIEHTYPGGSDNTTLSLDQGEFSTSGAVIYNVALQAQGEHIVRVYRVVNGANKYYGQTSFMIYP